MKSITPTQFLGVSRWYYNAKGVGQMNYTLPLFISLHNFGSFLDWFTTNAKQSTASFFQDNSKSLGRMLGFRSRNRRSELYSRNTVDHAETAHTLSTRTSSEHRDELDLEMCDGICIPLCLVAKTSKNKDGPKRWNNFSCRKRHNHIHFISFEILATIVV